MKKRAFVKYSKSGKLIPGTTIITSGKYPKGGPYKEIPYDLCCETDPCAPGGNPITVPYPSPFPFTGITFTVPTTLFYLYIECESNNANYWEVEFETPPVDNIDDFMDYLNSNFSYIGTFTYTVDPLDVTKYYLSLNTTTGFLDRIFFNTCPSYNFVLYAANYNP